MAQLNVSLMVGHCGVYRMCFILYVFCRKEYKTVRFENEHKKFKINKTRGQENQSQQ